MLKSKNSLHLRAKIANISSKIGNIEEQNKQKTTQNYNKQKNIHYNGQKNKDNKNTIDWWSTKHYIEIQRLNNKNPTKN